MDYFEVRRPNGDGLCSDKKCPCPEDHIPRGSGYLYISDELVEKRRDALRQKDALEKLERERQNLEKQLGSAVFMSSGSANPILMCEKGARLRGLDIDIAAADAAYWWETGLVPLRATPLQPTFEIERRVYSGKDPEELIEKIRTEFPPNKIHDILLIRYPKTIVREGEGKTYEEALASSKSYMPSDAIEFSKPEILQTGDEGVTEISAQDKNLALNKYSETTGGNRRSYKLECLLEPNPGFLGLGKKPGIWKFHWQQPVVVRCSYLIPANVLARYKQKSQSKKSRTRESQ